LTRLVKEWTKTTEEAYGVRGKKGREGEVVVISKLRSLGIKVEDCESDVSMQLAGIYIVIVSPNGVRTTVDIKSNINSRGYFYIDKNWKCCTSDLVDKIIHINVEKKQFVMYDVSEAKEQIEFGANILIKYHWDAIPPFATKYTSR